MPPKPLDFLQPTLPDATNVHNNIDDLIYQSDAENLWQKALNKVEQGMSGYKHPQPITGTAPDVALNPLLAARKIPSLMKLLKKINLKNPIYHHTNIPKAKEILKTGKIKPTSRFPMGHSKEKKVADFLKEIDEYGNAKLRYIRPFKAFSISRDPMFLSRPHSNIGTDVRFIMDRDDLIKKGYRIRPKAVSGFKKTPHYNVSSEDYKKIHGYYRNQMNPRFEFEERVLGHLPTKDIKLIDWVKTPKGYIQKLSDWTGSPTNTMPVPSKNFYDLIEYMMGTHKINVMKKKSGWDWYRAPELPLMMSEQVRSSLRKIQPYLMNVWEEGNQYKKLKSWEKLMSAPTYKYNPFKLNKPK